MCVLVFMGVSGHGVEVRFWVSREPCPGLGCVSLLEAAGMCGCLAVVCVSVCGGEGGRVWITPFVKCQECSY